MLLLDEISLSFMQVQRSISFALTALPYFLAARIASSISSCGVIGATPNEITTISSSTILSLSSNTAFLTEF